MKMYSIIIHGINKVWGFEVPAEPEWVEAWRADGLEVDEIIAEIDFNPDRNI